MMKETENIVHLNLHFLPLKSYAMKIVFYDLDKHGKLDYVCAWYYKSADYIKNTNIKSIEEAEELLKKIS